ncbi:MAG: tetratricopeptide repeat protein [Candidatus Melainabacteria bacterium]|nr:tetratricopeptide repeat protein [Candidatus Melainabacteria bacterium]
MKNTIATLSILLLASAFSAANAECPKWEKLSQSGQKSIDAGNFNKAEQTWLKAVTEAENCGERDPSMPLSLKRLGECYQKNGKYIEAADAFKKAGEQYKINGNTDTELTADLASLAKVYRTVEFSEINKTVADAFRESGVNLIGICKLDQGNRIQMNLNDKFVKTIDNKDVDQLSLEKLVSFDVLEDPDGSLQINNIKGLKVHAKMWVTIVQSRVQPKNPDGACAEVTATKMGISKTVSCKLPADSIDPMNVLIAKLRDFNNGVVKDETITASSTSSSDGANTTTSTTSTTTTTSTGTSTTSGAAPSTDSATNSSTSSMSGSSSTTSSTSSAGTSAAPENSNSDTKSESKP